MGRCSICGGQLLWSWQRTSLASASLCQRCLCCLWFWRWSGCNRVLHVVCFGNQQHGIWSALWMNGRMDLTLTYSESCKWYVARWFHSAEHINIQWSRWSKVPPHFVVPSLKARSMSTPRYAKWWQFRTNLDHFHPFFGYGMVRTTVWTPPLRRIKWILYEIARLAREEDQWQTRGQDQGTLLTNSYVLFLYLVLWCLVRVQVLLSVCQVAMIRQRLKKGTSLSFQDISLLQVDDPKDAQGIPKVSPRYPQGVSSLKDPVIDDHLSGPAMILELAPQSP